MSHSSLRWAYFTGINNNPLQTACLLPSWRKWQVKSKTVLNITAEKGKMVKGERTLWMFASCYISFLGLLPVLNLQWHPMVYLRRNPPAHCGSGSIMTTCHQNAEGSERQGFLSTSLQGSAFLRCSVLSPETLGSESLHSHNLKQVLITNFCQGFQTLSPLYLASSS